MHHYEHVDSERKERIAVSDGMQRRLTGQVKSRARGDHHEQGLLGKVEIGQHGVQGLPLIARCYENTGPGRPIGIR